MKNAIDLLKDNDWLKENNWWIGLILAVIGVILAVIGIMISIIIPFL